MEYNFRNVINACKPASNITLNLPWNMTLDSSLASFFAGKSTLLYLNIINCDGLNYINTMSNMFSRCQQLRYIDNLSNWNVSNVENMYNMFASCNGIKSETLEGISNWNTVNLKTMASMFYNCGNLDDNILHYISNWNTSNLQNISYMFFNCVNINNIEILSNWDMSNMKNMALAFTLYKSINNIPQEWNFINWKFNKIESFSRMFFGTNLINLKMGNCNSKNLINVWEMFPYTLQTLELSDWYSPADLGGLTGMFSNLSNLTDLKINNWKWGVTTGNASGANLFYNLQKLENIEITNWQYNGKYNVNIQNFFNNCYNLKKVNLSNWQGDPNCIHDTSYFFQSCTNLNSEELILENWNIKNLRLEGFFYNCWRITDVNFNWFPKNSDLGSLSNCFRNCWSLVNIDFYNKNTNITNIDSAFCNCYNLQEINLYNWSTTYGTRNLNYMFYNCYNLRNLYLNNFIFNSQMKTIGMLDGIPVDCNIWVKDQDAKNFILNNIRNDLTNIQIAS